MQKKIIGTIILVAALSLLVFNLFFKSHKGKEIVIDNTGKTETVNEQIQSEQPVETSEPETKKSDMAVKMGDSIDAFNIANSVVYEYIEHINSGNMQEAYKMLNKEYVQEMGLPYEAFKQKYTYDTEKAFKGETLLPSDYGTIISGYLIDYYGGESEDTENSFIPCSFTIYDTEPKTIADIGIKSISEVEKTANLPQKVSMKIYKKFITTDGLILYSTIENLGTDNFELDTGAYAFFTIDGNNSYTHKLLNSVFTDYELRPEEIKHYRIFIPGAVRVQDIGITLRTGEVIKIGGLSE